MSMICRAFLTVFQSLVSFMEDTMAHRPCSKNKHRNRLSKCTMLMWIYPFHSKVVKKSCTLESDSCNAGCLSPGPAGAANSPLLLQPAGRRCGSSSPRGSDAQPSTSPASSSGCVLQLHPPKGIMILNTAAIQLAKQHTVCGPVVRFYGFCL